MRKIHFLTIFLVVFLLNTSCKDDGGDSVIHFTNGAMPDFNLVDGSDDFINLTDFDNLNLKFTVGIGAGEPTSFDLKAFWQTIDGDLYGPVTLDTNVTSFPKEYSISNTDILSAFSELNGNEDLNVGDKLMLFTSFKFADGSVVEILDSNAQPNYYAADFSQIPDYKIKFDYIVSCPSSLGGTYNVISNGENTDGQPFFTDLAYTITLTDNGGGNYTISDGVAGAYQFWYCSPYGYCFETAGNFTDVCGSLSGSWSEGFGCGIELTGTVNPDGTLSIRWDNCFGDFANAVYKPQ